VYGSPLEAEETGRAGCLLDVTLGGRDRWGRRVGDRDVLISQPFVPFKYFQNALPYFLKTKFKLKILKICVFVFETGSCYEARLAYNF
jgi:hypothetical protein